MKAKTMIYNELFEVPQKSFDSHLALKDNNRIIFSGKFGMGKTTFLRQYFENHELYRAFFLYPVNYSVASNEDIFRYIKYDILFEMIMQGVEFGKLDFSFIRSLPSFFKSNLHKVAAAVVSMIPVVGKEIVEIYDKVQPVVQTMLEHHKNLQDANDEFKLVGDYLLSIEQKEGIYESGIITKLIEGVLSRLKNSVIAEDESEETVPVLKQNVLVIDDLDRLDPEHVFRLLNVFAAHFDVRGSLNGNKFGFDKIILIGDINNIKKIYAAKYGIEVDFNGYIDKFYTHEIFEFWNKTDLVDFSLKMLNHRNWKGGDEGEASFYVNKCLECNFMSDMLSTLVYNGMINMRSLSNRLVNGFVFERNIDVNGKRVFTDQLPIALQLKNLIKFVGSKESLIQIVHETQPYDFQITHGQLSSYLCQLFKITDPYNNKLESEGISLSVGGDKITGYFKDDREKSTITMKDAVDPHHTLTFDSFLFKRVLIMTLKLIRF